MDQVIDLHEYFDKIVVINLDRRIERMAAFEQECAKWNIIGVERVAAIDGKTLPVHPVVGAGAMGLIMTTISVIREAKEQGLRSILILEDDVYFRELIHNLHSLMSEVPEDWKMLYLGGHHIQKPIKISEHIGGCVQVFTTHSYAIHHTLFNTILTELTDPWSADCQIDLYFSRLQQRFPSYCFIPSITGQRAAWSDIENRWTDYNDNMDENLIFDTIPKKFLTVVIPCHDMGDNTQFLQHSLLLLHDQTFKDFNIVISDHSKNWTIANFIDQWILDTPGMNIQYIRKEYEHDNPSSNLNNCIRYANGEYIKILFQDDYLYDENALQHTVDAIRRNPGCKWLVTASEHTEDGITCTRKLVPRWNDRVIEGVNTIGGPSVVTIKNGYSNIYFDLDLIWLMDVDYYNRMHKVYGEPIYIPEVTVVNRLHPGQLTNILTDQQKEKEFNIIKKKYDTLSNM